MSIGFASRIKLAQAASITDRFEKSVVFVSPLLRPREMKMATALRGAGWKIILLYQQTTPFFPEKYFDVAIRGDSVDDLHVMARLIRPRVCHVFSGAVDELTLRFCREKPSLVVIDLNDIFCPALFDYLPERFEPTRECLELADGLSGRDLQAKFAARYDRFKLPHHILHFPEYSWIDGPATPEAVAKGDPNEVSVVSVGTFTLETQGMYDSAYLQLARMLTEQKIHFHIYPHWFYRKSRGSVFGFDQQNDFREFIELERQTPYLHLHESLPIDQLAKELTQYDFGLVSGGCEAFGQRLQFLTQKYMDSCYSGRIADYLDARLPVLINTEVTFNYRLLRHYGIALELNDLARPGFREKLLAAKRDPDLKARTERAARLMSLNRHGGRLGAFYERLLASRARPFLKQPGWLRYGKIVPFLGRAAWNIERQVIESSESAQALVAEVKESRSRERLARSHLMASANEVALFRSHTAELVRQAQERQSKIQGLQSDVDAQLSDIMQLQHSLDAQQVRINELRVEIDLALRINATYAEQITGGDLLVPALVAAASEETAEEKTDQERLRELAERRRADLIALEQQIVTRQQNIASLQQAVVAGQSQLGDLQTQLEAKQVHIADLQTEIDARQAQVAELAQQMLGAQERSVELADTLADEERDETNIRADLRIGNQQIDEIAGLLNWPELSDDRERLNGFIELVKLLNLTTRPIGSSKPISESWQLLNRKHLDELLRDGFVHFKRTIAMNYFTFPIQGGDPQIATLEARLGPGVSARCRKLADEHPDDPAFKLADQASYRYFVLLLWLYAVSIDRDGALDRLVEPEIGHPITIDYEGRLISQDLANSVIEYYSIRDATDVAQCERVLEIGAGYGRDAYVILSLHRRVKYFIVDIAPALYVAQRYLATVFPERKIFHGRDFATYREVQAEMSAADVVFLLPHQLARLPSDFFDLTINISSFGEMTRDQIAYYTHEIDRTSRGTFYTKQWRDSKNPFDALELKESDYPIPLRWQRIYSRECQVQASFFEAAYRIGIQMP
jgi:putative sugar O-methyltransferase